MNSPRCTRPSSNRWPALWLAVAAVLLVALTLSCLTGASARPPWRNEEPRNDPPSNVPDRVILTWAGDPATSQAVTWRTGETVGTAFGWIVPADPTPDFAEGARRIVAETRRLDSDAGPAHYHSVNFTGLSPNTLYGYRVGSDEASSEWFHFRTASAEPQPFSFLYLGDAQNGVLSYWSRAIRAAYSDAPQARFMIHAGDLVTDGFRDALWGEWFDACGWILGMLPTIPTPGNHEHRGADSDSALTPHWAAQFTLPENGIPGARNQVYFVDCQGVRVVCLDSNGRIGEQARWLERVLADNPNRWTVATFHHPVFSCSKGRDNEDLRRLWKPILDRHGVDLVLEGHDHVYARGSEPFARERIPVRETGPVYVVSVSGPKMYDLDRREWMDRAGENVQLYQVISVTPDTLYYRAMTVTGDPYDAFLLVKRDGALNRLVETLPPGSAERRFGARRGND